MKYKVYDSLGNYLRSFSSYKGAMTFKIMNNRLDWTIK